MTHEEELEIVQLMRKARLESRGYASFFGWSVDRDQEELGAAKALAESLELDGKLFFHELKLRGRGNDPPDLEALSLLGERLAFELTELVDGAAIQAYKAGRVYDWALWDRTKFIDLVSSLLTKKAKRFSKLKGSPYPGGYVIVIFTDEPELTKQTVENYLKGHTFSKSPNVSGSYLVLSYDPTLGRCPYFDLT
ncbi:hypothetical protein HH213_17200 [Duganella dendranthematis]|uniref:Uncharacterized protein n=1 Tax=Duganella dendranthematis TaxID=2728021 RepID=A0ABX6MCE4_9BURK|nr:hypothetical protein [Duganella dendranthematis]QJD91669.1 hypothetical protein HH213_17200 [Duganella dendranthematis]